MNLETLNLRINEGTMAAPFILTDNEVEVLVALAKSGGNVSIEGVVNTTSERISAFNAYIIKRAFPNLTILARETADSNWNIQLSSMTAREGTSVDIYAINTDLSTLKYKVESVDFECPDDLYSKEAFVNSLHIDMQNKTITVDKSRLNTSWTATVRLSFAPAYIEDPKDSDKKYVSFSAYAVKVEGLVVEMTDKIRIGDRAEVTARAVPQNHTKGEDIVFGATVTGAGVIMPSRWAEGDTVSFIAPGETCETRLNVVAYFGNTEIGVVQKELTIFNNATLRLEITTDDEEFDYSTVKVNVHTSSGETLILTASSPEVEVPMDTECTLTYSNHIMYDVTGMIEILIVNQIETTINLDFKKKDLTLYTLRVLLEQSNPAGWTRQGNREMINEILSTDGQYGSFVIDEKHKAYAKLNPENHLQFADGTPWNGMYGNAFRRLPKIYIRCDKEDGNDYLRVSNLPLPGYFEMPENWLGNYKGANVDGVLVSRHNTRAEGNKTITEFWNMAQGNGRDYGLRDYNSHVKLIALHLAAFGNSNSENTMGKGLQDAGNNEIYCRPQLGCTAGLGDGTGEATYINPSGGTTTFKQNKLWGMEALAGSQWEMIQGIYFSGIEACVYEGNKVSNSAIGRIFNRDPGMNFKGTYFKNMALGEHFDMVPIAGGGSDKTYWCDGGWSASSGQLFQVGGHSYGGSICGLSAAHSNDVWSNAGATTGARLAFYGDISKYERVDGAALVAMNG